MHCFTIKKSSFIIVWISLLLTHTNFSHESIFITKEEKSMFTFRKVTADDLSLLYNWFQETHVKEWWPIPQKNEFLEKFLERIRSKNTIPYLVLLNNNPLGYIQYYHIDRAIEKAGSWLPKELPETTVGIDQFIGNPEFIGKGYGTRFIKEFISFLTTTLEPQVTTIIVDPEPENRAAIRCYEKVGFTTYGIFTRPYGEFQLMTLNVKLHSLKQNYAEAENDSERIKTIKEWDSLDDL